MDQHRLSPRGQHGLRSRAQRLQPSGIPSVIEAGEERRAAGLRSVGALEPGIRCKPARAVLRVHPERARGIGSDRHEQEGRVICHGERIKARNRAGKWRGPFRLPLRAVSRTNPLRMAEPRRTAGANTDGATYAPAGALTITRAATTQREIDGLPDPLTIDLSRVERMDTVGAWILYRTKRDRGAKIVGAGETEASLLEQVSEYDVPSRVRPEQ